MAGEDTQVVKNQNVKPSKDKNKKVKNSALEMLKMLISNQPMDKQLDTLLQKYSELYDENQNLQNTCKSLQKSSEQSQKEKERINLEHSKAVLTKSRLEALCRELQRQNKVIKDDSMTRLKEEEERRQEVSNQFNSTLTEISSLMDENSTNNSKLREENSKMALRLQDLVSQHKDREENVDKIIKQRELESQLAQAKFAKLQLEIAEHKETLLTERKTLLEEMSSLQNKLQEKSLIEISLRTQLTSYSEKFAELQSTMEKSNQIFDGFKKEIESMNKMIKKLEKETKVWKEKYERANVALYQMFNERTEMETKISNQSKQNNQLQSLCRALQQQNKDLRSQLNENGIKSTEIAQSEENDLNGEVHNDNTHTEDPSLECPFLKYENPAQDSSSEQKPVETADCNGTGVQGNGVESANVDSIIPDQMKDSASEIQSNSVPVSVIKATESLTLSCSSQESDLSLEATK